MADVVLGPAGSTVLVDLDICAKTGRATSQRVTLRGTTTPGWVTVLLLLTVVGFVLAKAMTSRSYRISLPLAHAAYARWKTIQIAAWAVGLCGVGSVVLSATTDAEQTALFGSLGIVLVATGLVGGTINTRMNGLGLCVNRNDNLVLTGAHPAFVQAVVRASAEPIPW